MVRASTSIQKVWVQSPAGSRFISLEILHFLRGKQGKGGRGKQGKAQGRGRGVKRDWGIVEGRGGSEGTRGGRVTREWDVM